MYLGDLSILLKADGAEGMIVPDIEKFEKNKATGEQNWEAMVKKTGKPLPALKMVKQITRPGNEF